MKNHNQASTVSTLHNISRSILKFALQNLITEELKWDEITQDISFSSKKVRDVEILVASNFGC